MREYVVFGVDVISDETGGVEGRVIGVETAGTERDRAGPGTGVPGRG